MCKSKILIFLHSKSMTSVTNQIIANIKKTTTSPKLY